MSFHEEMSEILKNADQLHKPDLCAKIAERTGLPLRAVTRFFDAYHDVIMEEVARGRVVHLHRFGKFHSRHMKSQKRIHPGTGEEQIVPEMWRPSFRFGETFKRTVRRLGEKRDG